MNDNLVSSVHLDAMEKNEVITTSIINNDCWNSTLFIKIALFIGFVIFVIFITNISNVSLVRK